MTQETFASKSDASHELIAQLRDDLTHVAGGHEVGNESPL